MHSIVCLVVIAAIIITAICIVWNYHNSIIRDSGTYLEVIFEKPLYSITNKELLEYYKSCGSDAISSDYRYWCKARRRAINRVCYKKDNISSKKDNMNTIIKENKKLKRKCKKSKRLLSKRKKWQGNIFKIIFAIIIAIIAYKYGKKNNNKDNTVLWNQQ